MYINRLKVGQKVQIYFSNGSMGRGISGIEKNIVEVIWAGEFASMGMATFLDGTPVGLPICDRDIVIPFQPLNKVKNMFWDAGVNIGILDFNITKDHEAFEAKIEVMNTGSKNIILLDGDTLYNCYPNAWIIGKLSDNNIKTKISKFYK